MIDCSQDVLKDAVETVRADIRAITRGESFDLFHFYDYQMLGGTCVYMARVGNGSPGISEVTDALRVSEEFFADLDLVVAVIVHKRSVALDVWRIYLDMRDSGEVLASWDVVKRWMTDVMG